MRRAAWLLFAACHNPTNAAAPDATAPDATARIDAAAPDAPADAAPLDPWTQPLGAALAGVALADGWTDLRALPVPMAIAGGWTDSLFAAPDGLHLRFAYQPMDFFDFFISNGATQTLTGPELAGETATRFQLFDATLTAAGWTIAYDPVHDPSLIEASPAANAGDDLLIFSEFSPTGLSQLYYASYANGAWSAPTALPINDTTANNDNAKILGDLTTAVSIYFESNRGSAMQRTLYTSTYVAATDSFTPVTPVAGIAATDSDDSQPFVTADQQTLYFTSIRAAGYGVFVATRQPDGSFGDIHPIAMPTTSGTYAGNVTILGEASVVSTPEGDLLYMMCGLAENLHGAMTYHDADFIALEPCVARRPKS